MRASIRYGYTQGLSDLEPGLGKAIAAVRGMKGSLKLCWQKL